MILMLILNSKISCIFILFKKNSILSYIEKKLHAREYLKTAYSSQGYVKIIVFGLILGELIGLIWP